MTQFSKQPPYDAERTPVETALTLAGCVIGIPTKAKSNNSQKLMTFNFDLMFISTVTINVCILRT